MLPKYREIIDLLKKGATVEAQEQIMALREGALELQEENFSLKEKVMGLEARLQNKNDWESEIARYQLVTPWRGPSSVFALKSSLANDELPHYICPTCFNKGEKIILNPNNEKGGMMVMVCANCKARIDTGYRGVGPAKYAEDHKNEES